MQSRLNSKVLWVAVFALVYFILKTWCGIEIAGWDIFVDLILTILIALGIVNNPTDKNKL